ncbi:hypothetical protein BCR36DRAFT_369106 [Piromyces finnis]|uniref:Uncharacterized protein n=1 Tax=Piromyces finnis TaxID=1754191 RepID=A0A1Y1VDM9_9FUNG|nr:hypothetical protein BCR36DRAFT_369106 [Piromyces finnis]|eukprot:ORX53441.1 hypothetical protein BCR36DRAFT_369106 [Piromyces finnis]
MKDATLFTEKTINSSILTIYENLIEMINISIYFDSLDNKEEENKIDNPLKYPRSGIKDIEDEVSKDVDFLNGICNSNNLSILSNKNCGNILSKDLTALVNLEKNENKKDTTQKNQKIDLEPLTEKIKKWNQEIENLRHEHDILKAQYKYADQDEDDNTQVLHSLYTLSQHLATYIESFNLRFPLEIESWIYTNPNINDQVYSAELGNVISRIKKLMKTYHQIIDNIANTRSSYEKLISKPNTTIPPISTIKKETSISEDYILDSISSSLASPISPFSNSYTLYQSKENLTLSHSFNQLNKTTLGGRINIDSEIKEIQQMENELQQSIDILMKSKERRIKNNPNLMQIELQSLSQSSSPSNLSLSSINTPISSKIHSSSNLDITDSNSKTKVINDNNNNTLSNTEKENNDVIIIEDSMDLE